MSNYFIVTQAVRSLFPDLRIGLVFAEGLNNVYSEELEAFVKMRFNSFIREYTNKEELFLSHKNIEAWRETYRRFGVNPKKKKSSSEAILTRTLQKGFIPHINPVVDCYLACVTKYFFPLGGFDLHKIKGDILLDISNGSKMFRGVGEENEELVPQGEVVYADAERVLTRYFNYRDCDATKIDENSKKMIFVVEAALDTITDAEIQETSTDLAQQLEQFFSAKTNIVYVDKNNDRVDL
jgi:DNA/RNA-binding domain of Phe-tRNA-synthetase-like protein